MSITVTLNLPDELFSKASGLAKLINRDLDEILLEAIAFSLSSTADEDKFSDLASLSDEEVLALSEMQMEKEQDLKFSTLLDQQQAGNISEIERALLWSMMQIYQIKLLQKVQGLREAVKRGLISSLES